MQKLNRRDVLGAGLGFSLLGCKAPGAPDAFHLGVDVSNNNGEVNWAQVKRAGVGFAYIKASQGEVTKDPLYDHNLAGARAAGLIIGSYHLFAPGEHGVPQAQNFLRSAQFQACDLPPMLDLETEAEPAQSDQYRSRVEDWLSTVGTGLSQQGYRDHAAGLYLRRDIWQSLGEPDWSVYPLWIAEWDVASPSLPQVWQDYCVWQYTDQGRIAGISTPIDLSRGGPALQAHRL
ncbi:glycoside hydrolase family 25 protein [Woodsholea maritima]|uniref:glycoside hydrolase family 25 protein n=1 Tax=Woodsholea maritima TaxID=240237 RepID=UPI0003A212D7|nr:glycoside hydrolase family 25 protein [Woodsholea maritima]